VEYRNNKNGDNAACLLGEVPGLDKVVVMRIKQRGS